MRKYGLTSRRGRVKLQMLSNAPGYNDLHFVVPKPTGIKSRSVWACSSLFGHVWLAFRENILQHRATLNPDSLTLTKQNCPMSTVSQYPLQDGSILSSRSLRLGFDQVPMYLPGCDHKRLGYPEEVCWHTSGSTVFDFYLETCLSTGAQIQTNFNVCIEKAWKSIGQFCGLGRVVSWKECRVSAELFDPSAVQMATKKPGTVQSKGWNCTATQSLAFKRRAEQRELEIWSMRHLPNLQMRENCSWTLD